MHRIFTAPHTTPGELTLMATVETWAALLAELGRDDLARYAEVDRAVKQAAGEPLRRVTLPDDLARYVLRMAGVSA